MKKIKKINKNLKTMGKNATAIKFIIPFMIKKPLPNWNENYIIEQLNF